MEPNSERAEAERLIAMAEKFLESRDLPNARDFARLAQESDPLVPSSDHILAVADVLLASDTRPNGYYDWYAVLQIAAASADVDIGLIRNHYRRLALLLRPDKNTLPYVDQAFRLVDEAWSVLSDPSRKSVYDREVRVYSKVSLPGRDKSGKKLRASDKLSSFWTGCPYCCRLYEYPKLYEDCCLRCQSCHKAFHAVVVPSLPPLLPGKDAYYCPWGGFPFGSMPGIGAAPNWAPPPVPHFPAYGPPTGNPPLPQPPLPMVAVGPTVTDIGGGNQAGVTAMENVAPRKRGRPRKNTIQ